MTAPDRGPDPEGASALYLVALGGNRRSRHGGPRATIEAALAALESLGTVRARSTVIDSAPLGPSRRRYANAAALLATPLDPPALLAACQAMERRFGRRRGRRWGERVLDLDLILWNGGRSAGRWRSRTLTLPHAAFHNRAFVLTPAAAIAPDWRDPASGRTLRQLAHRLTRPTPDPRSRTHVGP